MNERERALDLLRRVERDSLFASITLIGETGFVRTLVLGVLRWRSRLDDAIEIYSERKINKLDSLAVHVLRIGIYQLHFMDVASYAAVSDTVNLAPKRARGLVNAILRRATKGLPEARNLPARVSHPKWMLDRWSRIYGEKRAIAIAEANQELSYPDVLLLSGAPPPSAEKSLLAPDVYKLKGSSADLDRTRFYPMDEGSAVIAAIAANAGAGILDVAAAPGGKTLYMQHRGAKVTSMDISLSRLQPLVGRQKRLVVADGRLPPFRTSFPVVLLDAPCSATGTIRKNPELKWRLKEADIAGFAKLQKEMLESAFELAGDAVIYSTCSLEPEENDAIVKEFPREDITPLVPESARPWIQDGVLRLTPESGADGFTAFLLRRSR